MTLILTGHPAPPSKPRASPGLRELERDTAITQLFHRQYPQLVRLAILSGAEEEAEEIVEEAFFQLHRRWNRLHDPEAAPAYLRSVICNLSRMRLRHLEVVHRKREALRSDADSAESVAVEHEDQRELITALRRLPARQREALVLRYWLGLHEAEVAREMGISCGAVKAHTSRGIAGLRRALESRR